MNDGKCSHPDAIRHGAMRLFNAWSEDHNASVITGGDGHVDAANRAVAELRVIHGSHGQKHRVVVRGLMDPADICLVLSGYDSSDDMEMVMGTYHSPGDGEVMWGDPVTVMVDP